MLSALHEYPWHRCKPGYSFFIPTLDPWTVGVQGVQYGRKALGKNTPISFKVGVYDGMLGVMFTVKPVQAAPKPSA